MSRPLLLELLLGLAGDGLAAELRRAASRLDGRDPEAELAALSAEAVVLSGGVEVLARRLVDEHARCKEVRTEHATVRLRARDACEAVYRAAAAAPEEALAALGGGYVHAAVHAVLDVYTTAADADARWDSAVRDHVAALRARAVRAEVEADGARERLRALAASGAVFDPGED